MKLVHVLVVCAVLAATVIATESEVEAEADVEADMELSAKVDHELETETETEVEAEKRKKKRSPVRGATKLHRPRIDMSLLRPTANIVYVPKGDPRARAPTFSHPHSDHHRAGPAKAAAAKPKAKAPKLVSQKAPRNGKPTKPTTAPVNPTPAKPSGIPVGAAPVLKAGAPTYASAACTAQKGSCISTTSCSGNVVHGICPGPASIACCVPKSAPPAATCLSNFNAASFASKATAMQLSYRNNGVVYSQSSRQFGSPPAVKYADCSSFVTSVLDAMGWDCLFASGRYTAAMIPIMQSRGGFHSTPKQGDIVMWTSHTGIVTEACAGGNVRMVAMGTHGCADTGCITLSSLPEWGSGSYLGFWTPH